MLRKPTLAQVSSFSGLSIATVSRAFTNPELLSAEALKKVMHASEILQYQFAKRSNSVVEELKVAVFINLFSNRGEFEILRGISNAMRAWRFELILFESLDMDKEILEIRKIVARKEIAAVIFVGESKNQDTMHLLKEANIPTVAISDIESNVSRISSSLEKATNLVYEYLKEFPSSKLLFIGFYPDSRETKETVILSSLRRLNRDTKSITIHEYLIDSRQKPGPVDFIDVLRSEKPDAIFASNDYLAVQVYRDCLKLGYLVPDDIQIIGHGGFDLAETLNISSVNTFLDAQGRRAAEIIYAQTVNKERVGERFVETISPQLTRRSTTKN